ncbi:MAG: PfkB family carbohydrate kinase [Candidatus Bathyarchaeia archaeon]
MGIFTIVGHVAIDKVITERSIRTQLGGPPTYVNLAADIFGEKIETVTKIGDDIPGNLLTELEQLGIDAREHISYSESTTKFILDYRSVERDLWVEGICEDIYAEDITPHSDVVMLAPIVGEIPSETTRSLEADILALDPQGYVRQVTASGKVKYKRWADNEVLEELSVYKSSEKELRYIVSTTTILKGIDKILNKWADIAIITQAKRGAIIGLKGEKVSVPAYKGTKVVDPTGAGDVFFSVFLSSHLKGEDPIWSVSMGNATSSYLVESKGPTIDASVRAINERAEAIYEDTINL